MKPKNWNKETLNKTSNDYEFEKSKDECTFSPKINKEMSTEEIHTNVNAVKGMDKVMERMRKARESLLEKKLMTERGMPATLRASIGKPEPVMSFGSNTDKHKSAFGTDGSQINPKAKKQQINDLERC